MRTLAIIFAAGIVIGCGERQHRAYTLDAIRAQAVAVEHSSAKAREALAVITSLAELAEQSLPEGASQSLEDAEDCMIDIETRSENIVARVGIIEMDLGRPDNVPEVVLGSDADNQMTVEHAGLAVRRNAKRIWWSKLPERMVEAVVGFAADLIETTGTVVIERVSGMIPRWLKIVLGVVAALAFVLLVTTGVLWVRTKWYKLGLISMVKVADEQGISKTKLRDATRGNAGQQVFRKLRDRGELQNGRTDPTGAVSDAIGESDTSGSQAPAQGRQRCFSSEGSAGSGEGRDRESARRSDSLGSASDRTGGREG